MSDDEVALAVLAAGSAIAFWGRALSRAGRTTPPVRPGRRLAAAVAVWSLAVGGVLVSLLTAADPQVRASPGLTFLFLMAAADTLAIATLVASGLGLSMSSGFVRGRNAAVGWAVAGLWIGTALVNAGANTGRGDTIYTTLGPLALAFATLLVLTGILAAATGGFPAVRLDRDQPAGVRLGGLFMAWGTILGLAAAGDFESARATWIDFARYGWPVLVLLTVAVPAEWWLRPTVERPRVSWLAGLFPAAAYLCAAAGWVLFSVTGFQPVRASP
jgi:hypothetical protein